MNDESYPVDGNIIAIAVGALNTKANVCQIEIRYIAASRHPLKINRKCKQTPVEWGGKGSETRPPAFESFHNSNYVE